MSDITLGDHIKFPAYGEKSVSSQVVFITGKRGSGKSYTAGVMMEEFDKAQLQFVCFDVLSAHAGMDALPNVESIRPREDETIDMNLLVSKIATGNKSLIIDIGSNPFSYIWSIFFAISSILDQISFSNSSRMKFMSLRLSISESLSSEMLPSQREIA